MDILEALRDGLSGWQTRPPGASPDVIDKLSVESPITLPVDYLNLLRFSNGGEGELGVEPGWFQLWPAENVVEHNRGYNLSEWLPGFFGFGSNGGGELFAFDARHGEPWPVVMVPFCPLDSAEAVTMASSFAGWLRALGRVKE
jgi:SMI1 / KNR4 family (SUKH-1)